MKKILLACSAGMSTSLLETSMKKYIKENDLKFTVIAQDSASAKSSINEYDVILLGPQVKFMLKSFQELASDKIVDVIPMQMYGLMQGDKVIQMVEELLKK